jgi:hypothetical protein
MFSLEIILLIKSIFFADTAGQSPDRKNFETALLGKRAQFQCSVQSPNAAEVEIWWEFEGRNITQDGLHYEVSSYY